MQVITKSKVTITRKETKIDSIKDILFLVDELESTRGMFLSSGTEYPGRYSRWETGFTSPPVEIIAYMDKVIFKPLNEKGEIIVQIFEKILTNKAEFNLVKNEYLEAKINFSNKIFKEEDRSKQPSILTPIRILLDAFKYNIKDALGFYGAFGFDLLFQFDKIELVNKRNPDTPVIRLFFPDKIYTYDRKKEECILSEYDFSYENLTTEGIEIPKIKPLKDQSEITIQGEINSNITDEKYASMVERAKEKMRAGDVFELVLRRKYYTQYNGSSSKLFLKMIDINPSPYQFFCQFLDEQLIGTSPEMFVRVTDKRVETCPISGTIKRGNNVIEDEKQIKTLLNSKKDEVELTMCTDVDRNDKSRICKPGSVRLLGRRQIEKYKGLFHTVDHVEGILRDDCNAIDAFLSHMWAVTLMGSPKSTASRFIEEFEDEPREYYGGAVGVMFCNGNMNTGITIRTIHLKNNIANYSVGASLVYDSIGEEEARETQIKATSFFNIFKAQKQNQIGITTPPAKGLRVVVIDNEDSFVNTLSDYFRQTGALVVTYRHGVDIDIIKAQNPDLILHSPGPKLPKDFNMHYLIEKLAELDIPQFGVCLGLQGIAETFGAKLKRIETPRQGKTWIISHNNDNIFENLTQNSPAGAYHSWVIDETTLPDCLQVNAKCELGYIMGISHKTKPIWAVQFHPESIMSTENDFGHKLIENVVMLARKYKNERNSK
ncbi:MAG: anthranilate synthase component I [Candidatus Gastranaerophilales bacterium]|nr:anthranilate synthase component I [Candidatus Gastranaerophilales bacterium]